jgi:hypothetical protein
MYMVNFKYFLIFIIIIIIIFLQCPKKISGYALAVPETRPPIPAVPHLQSWCNITILPSQRALGGFKLLDPTP